MEQEHVKQMDVLKLRVDEARAKEADATSRATHLLEHQQQVCGVFLFRCLHALLWPSLRANLCAMQAAQQLAATQAQLAEVKQSAQLAHAANEQQHRVLQSELQAMRAAQQAAEHKMALESTAMQKRVHAAEDQAREAAARLREAQAVCVCVSVCLCVCLCLRLCLCHSVSVLPSCPPLHFAHSADSPNPSQPRSPTPQLPSPPRGRVDAVSNAQLLSRLDDLQQAHDGQAEQVASLRAELAEQRSRTQAVDDERHALQRQVDRMQRERLRLQREAHCRETALQEEMRLFERQVSDAPLPRARSPSQCFPAHSPPCVC